MDDCFSFLSYVYRRIFYGDFISEGIQYSSELTRVQIYKLKKINPSIPETLLKEIHRQYT